MNVNDLINELQKIKNRDTTVLIDGYEWGMEPLQTVREIVVTLNEKAKVLKFPDNSMGGEYELAGSEDKIQIKAIYFPRRGN